MATVANGLPKNRDHCGHIAQLVWETSQFGIQELGDGVKVKMGKRENLVRGNG